MREYIQFWPQIFVIVHFVFTIIKHSLFYGQTRTLQLNPVTNTLTTIGYIYVLVLGGFFGNWGMPQIIYAALAFIVVMLLLFVLFFYSKIKSELPKGGKVKHTISGVTWHHFGGVFLLWWGDFFDSFYQFIMQ